MDETTKGEIIRKATTAGHLRMNQAESMRLLDWMLANGFVYTGEALKQAPARKKPRAIRPDGTPIHD